MNPVLHKIITWLIAAVWLVNGLFCKVLNMVPRHQLIVERILQLSNARTVTILIGMAEILMAVWIVSGIGKRLNVIFQIVVILLMNTLEFFFASDLLLWGKLNMIFAALFSLLIYVHDLIGVRKNTIQ
ncbi:MAG: hypothetical protein EOP51_03705 [Sphingobacteriales bacterium]|nr:MAG: hypothetical protein EOP51_03705 [Sphingobacteriales bacterium]